MELTYKVCVLSLQWFFRNKSTLLKIYSLATEFVKNEITFWLMYSIFTFSGTSQSVASHYIDAFASNVSLAISEYYEDHPNQNVVSEEFIRFYLLQAFVCYNELFNNFLLLSFHIL